MNPLTKLPLQRETNYLTKFAAFRDTIFAKMVEGVYYENGAKMCIEAPVLQIPFHLDQYFTTKNCANVEKYILEEYYDDEGLSKKLVQ